MLETIFLVLGSIIAGIFLACVVCERINEWRDERQARRYDKWCREQEARERGQNGNCKTSADATVKPDGRPARKSGAQGRI